MLWAKAALVLSIMVWHEPGDPSRQYTAEAMTSLEMCEYAKANYERLAEYFKDDPTYQDVRVYCVDPETRQPFPVP